MPSIQQEQTNLSSRNLKAFFCNWLHTSRKWKIGKRVQNSGYGHLLSWEPPMYSSRSMDGLAKRSLKVITSSSLGLVMELVEWWRSDLENLDAISLCLTWICKALNKLSRCALLKESVLTRSTRCTVTLLHVNQLLKVQGVLKLLLEQSQCLSTMQALSPPKSFWTFRTRWLKEHSLSTHLLTSTL